MLVKEKKYQEEDGSIGYYEAFFESSNILQTTYFPASNRLYISFGRGGVHSYENVTEELYEEFKTSESQGKFFLEKIKSQPNVYKYRKEYTLYPDEVKELKEIVEKATNPNEELVFTKDESIGVPLMSADEEPSFTFTLDNEEVIKINKEGFFWKGNLVEEDKEIYQRFKEWLDQVFPNTQE